MNTRNGARLLVLGLAIGLGSWWAGARWGSRGPVEVQAVPTALPQAAAGALSEEESSNVRIYQAASPAVANIVTRAVQYDWFMNPVPQEGAGSGFVIDDRGHVLTNYHVIQGAESVEVTLGDGKDRTRYRAQVIGGDSRNDVALLRIDPRGRKLARLTLGDSSKLQVGQRVLAIGNPFGRFQSTLTTGVVSALGRTVQTGQTTFIDEAIQTDAAINQGNSGGPLLNSAGQVIGINSAIFTPTGTTAGIGFAIPINTAKRIAEDLIRDGRIHRAYLGVRTLALWPDLAEALSLSVDEGMLVEQVTPGSPADRAGLRGGNRAVMAGFQRILIGGDVITAIDGKPVANELDLNVALNRKRPGDSATLTIQRGRQKLDLKVTLADAPAARD
jgi:putative serine protease PepD